MFELFFLGMLIVVLVMFRIKNRYVRWAFILGPPLLLVILFWIPFDIFSMMAWIPAGIAFIWSIVGIPVRLIKIKNGRSNGKGPVTHEKERLVRPVLTIIIFIAAVMMVKLSRASADRYGMEIAKQIQSQVQKEGVCPERIEGWQDAEQDDWYRSRIFYGEYLAKYVIRYIVSEDEKEFTISVRHNIDEALCIYGGVDRELRAEVNVEDRSYDVPVE